MATLPDVRERRVLVLARFAHDAVLTQQVLASVAVDTEVCPDVPALCASVAGGAGCVLVAEEMLRRDDVDRLVSLLQAEPAWSDMPILVCTSGTRGPFRDVASSQHGAKALAAHANVTFLDRPLRLLTMVSAVQAALRARTRQYEARGFIEELAAARVQAERNSRTKDEFLATVSHELRTPLNAMLGWARMLAGGKLGAAVQAKAIAAIERNAVSQAKLIEDLLDVSRIISGNVRLDVQSVDLLHVLEAATDAVRPAMEAKTIRFAPVLDPSAGAVLGDPQRLQQVFWNLLANAVKFTRKGGRIGVTLQRVDSSVEITVTDDGEGIRAEFLPHVFDRFQQADGSISRTHGGLGLGLAIARHLVELHGGTIAAESGGPGRGATFRVTLPVAPTRISTPPRAPVDARPANEVPMLECPPELSGLRVLLLDDEKDALDLLAAILAPCGAVTTCVQSAGEALQALTEGDFDVLVSDIGLRGDDGYSFIRRVRALGEPKGAIAAAALTAYARAEDRRKALLSGFQMHIAKPIEPAEFVAVVANLARIAVK